MSILHTPDDPQGRAWMWQMNAWLVIMLIVALTTAICYVVEDRRPLLEPTEPPPLEERLPSRFHPHGHHVEDLRVRRTIQGWKG